MPGGQSRRMCRCERCARATLARGVARLESAGVPSAPLAAELLLLHLLGRDRTWLYAHPEHALSSGRARPV